MYGDAFDVSPTSASLSSVDAECRAHGAGFVLTYTSHVHCDWRNDAKEDAFYGSGSSSLPPPPTGLSATTLNLGDLASVDVVGADCGEVLKEWTAFSSDGTVLTTFTGPDFVPPADTVEVEVVIGRAMTVRRAWPQ